jgi:penicillin-binding protein 2
MDLQEELLARKKSRRNPFVIREGQFETLDDPAYQLDWAEETFLSGDSDKEMLRRTFDLSKLRYISVFILLFFLIIFCRVFWLQVVKGGYYYSLAEGNRLKLVTIESKRGIIYDKKMRPLVKNEPNFVLYLVPSDLPRDVLARDEILRRVGAILDKDSRSVSLASGSLELVNDTPSFQLL